MRFARRNFLKLSSSLAAFGMAGDAVPQQASPQPARSLSLNVRDFGAKGDGTTKDTAAIAGVHVTGFSGPLLGIHNVTGKGIDGAAEIDGPTIPDPVPSPGEPYRLH
jgi:hypothetical protein